MPKFVEREELLKHSGKDKLIAVHKKKGIGKFELRDEQIIPRNYCYLMSFQGLIQRFYWVALTHPVFVQKYFIFMRIIVKSWKMLGILPTSVMFLSF